MNIKKGIDHFDSRTNRVLDLSMELSSIPGVSVPEEDTDFEAINKSYDVARKFAKDNGLRTIEMSPDAEHPSPFLMVTFQENDPDGSSFRSDIALVGHLDVVPAQNEEQFNPRIEGDMLIGRGTADMKTVVATQLVWMAEQQAKEGPKPPVVVMVSFCEENGSVTPHGTQHAIKHLSEELNAEVELAIVGERTGEIEGMGKIPVGPICDANRGFGCYRAESKVGMTGLAAFEELISFIKSGRQSLKEVNHQITSVRMHRQDDWRTSFANPFIEIGADPDIPDFSTATLISFAKEAGVARHAALVSPDDSTVVEGLWEITKKLQAQFGRDKVKLHKLKIGEDKNYNTVTGAGSLELVVAADQEEVTKWLENEGNDIEADISLINSELPAGSEVNAVMGLDIRELPEHKNLVARWISESRERLEALGIELEVSKKGDGWECPQDNPHLEKLRAAYSKITGMPPVSTGKRHGNDGRFFGGNAVVWGQTGINPHGPNEAHYIPSILTYLKTLDEFSAKY